MSININLLGEQFQEIMKQHSERMKKITEPLLNLQKLPVFEELQKNMQDLSRLTEGVALKKQEAFERIADLHNHSGLKALSEQMELMSRELTAKLSIDLVSPILKDLQSSLNGLEISEDKFLSALEKLEKKDFVEKFENTVSNTQKGHSTAQGVSIGVSEVLAFLMFILMLIQTIDNSTEKEIKELSEGQDLTNQLLQSLVGYTDKLINKSKDESLKLLIANEAAPLRTQPDISSDTLITLFKGQHLDFLREKDNWYKVQFYDFSNSETGIGWVQKKYIIPEVEIRQAQTKKLGEVAKLKNGFAFKSKNYSDEGIPVIRISDIKDNLVTSNEAKRVPMRNEYEEYKIEEGSILIAMSGATTGKFGIYKSNEVALQNQRVGKFVYDDNQITNKFLFYLLYKLKREILKEAYGGAQPNISSKKIEEMEIKLPPLPTQHRIVEKIEELFSDLDNGIENLKKAKQQLETYKQSVLKAAFEGKLTKEWREQQEDLPTPEELLKYIEAGRKKHREKKLEIWQEKVKDWKEKGEPGRKPTKPRKSKITESFSEGDIKKFPDLPENWQWIKFDKINFVETNLVDPANFQSYPHIAPNYIEKMTGRLLDYSTIEEDGVTSKKHLFFEGQIIYSKIRPYLSKLIIAPFDGLCSADMYPIESVLNTDYIYYYMLSDTFLNQASSAGSRSVLPKINQKELGIVAFPVCSHKEQEQIVQILESYLSVIDNTLSSVNSELRKTGALRQSILKKAFKGKLIQN